MACVYGYIYVCIVWDAETENFIQTNPNKWPAKKKLLNVFGSIKLKQMAKKALLHDCRESKIQLYVEQFCVHPLHHFN